MDSSTPNPAANANMPATSNSTAPQGLPTTWPGAFGIYRYSRDAIRRNIGLIIGLTVAYIAVELVIGLLKIGFVGTLLNAVIGALYSVALVRALVGAVRGQKLSAKQAFGDDFAVMALKMFGLELVVGLTLLVSLALLIVPFFFVYPRLLLAQYYLVDKNMGISEAFKASWDATKGNVGKAWGIVGASILMALLMITIIGIPFAIYFLIMYSAAFAILYVFLEKHQPAVEQPAATQPVAQQ